MESVNPRFVLVETQKFCVPDSIQVFIENVVLCTLDVYFRTYLKNNLLFCYLAINSSFKKNVGVLFLYE